MQKNSYFKTKMAKFCYDTNLYCNTSVIPLVNYCLIYTGTFCNFPCSEDQCEKEILEFTDCTGRVFSERFFIILIKFLADLGNQNSFLKNVLPV